jgi:hypothetical protein
MIDDIYLKTLAMHIAGGLLAGQADSNRYIDTPGITKSEHLANDVFKYADEIMKRFNKLDKEKEK